jgi:hypothetical protein
MVLSHLQLIPETQRERHLPKMRDSNVTVHVGSQDNNRNGEAELQFASREFDRNTLQEIVEFVNSEIQSSSGFILMYVTFDHFLKF